MNYNVDSQQQANQPYMIQRMTQGQRGMPMQQMNAQGQMAMMQQQNQQQQHFRQQQNAQQIPQSAYNMGQQQAAQQLRMSHPGAGSAPPNMLYQQQQQHLLSEEAQHQQNLQRDAMLALPMDIRTQIQNEPDPERRKAILQNFQRKRQMEQQIAAAGAAATGGQQMQSGVMGGMQGRMQPNNSMYGAQQQPGQIPPLQQQQNMGMGGAGSHHIQRIPSQGAFNMGSTVQQGMMLNQSQQNPTMVGATNSYGGVGGPGSVGSTTNPSQQQQQQFVQNSSYLMNQNSVAPTGSGAQASVATGGGVPQAMTAYQHQQLQQMQLQQQQMQQNQLAQQQLQQQQQQMHHVQSQQHLGRPASRSSVAQMNLLQGANLQQQQQQSPLVQMGGGPGSVPSHSIPPQQQQQQQPSSVPGGNASSGGPASVGSQQQQQPTHPQRNTPLNYQGSPAVVQQQQQQPLSQQAQQQSAGPNSVTSSGNLQPVTPSNRSIPSVPSSVPQAAVAPAAQVDQNVPGYQETLNKLKSYHEPCQRLVKICKEISNGVNNNLIKSLERVIEIIEERRVVDLKLLERLVKNVRQTLYQKDPCKNLYELRRKVETYLDSNNGGVGVEPVANILPDPWVDLHDMDPFGVPDEIREYILAQKEAEEKLRSSSRKAPKRENEDFDGEFGDETIKAFKTAGERFVESFGSKNLLKDPPKYVEQRRSPFLHTLKDKIM